MTVTTNLLTFKKRFYLFICQRERENESTSRGSSRQREKQAHPLSREPDAGLDLRTPGSQPELKADT